MLAARVEPLPITRARPATKAPRQRFGMNSAWLSATKSSPFTLATAPPCLLQAFGLRGCATSLHAA
jgi:hypothetical protein